MAAKKKTARRTGQPQASAPAATDAAVEPASSVTPDMLAAAKDVSAEAAAKLAGCEPGQVLAARDYGNFIRVVWCDDERTFRQVYPK